ncbi:unnamed protein product [Ixodes hexagonus]
MTLEENLAIVAKTYMPLGTNDLDPNEGSVTATQNGTFVRPQGGDEASIKTCSKMREALVALRKVAWILPLAYTYMWTAAIFGMFPPFYPALATSRGLEAWKFGFVFSALKCGMSFGAFSITKVIKCLSPTKTYLLGQAGSLLFCLCSGSLYWAPSGDTLLWLSLLIFTFGGIFLMMLIVTMYAAATSVCSNNPGVLTGTMEAIYGIGNVVGSVAGGALIDLWAFPLPFFVVGVVQALSSPFIAIYGVIPKERPQDRRSKAQITGKNEGGKCWFLLADPEFLVCSVMFSFNWIIMGFNQTTLEPHLSQFQLSSTHLGEIYMVQSAGYVIGSVLSATFSNIQKERAFLSVAHIMAVLAYLIVGPVVFIPTAPNLWMSGSAQLFIGIASSAYFCCPTSLLHSTALRRGCPDNLATSSFVSSVTFGCAVLCACVTAPTAGYVAGACGYRTASMVLFGVLVAWTPVTLVLWLRPSWLKGSKRFHHPMAEGRTL